MNEEGTRPQPEKPCAKSPGPSGWARLLMKLFVCGCVIALLVCAALAVVLYLLYGHVTGPGIPGETIAITIPAGASGREIGILLQREGLVEHHTLFRAALRLDRSGRPIKCGPYTLARGLSPMQFLHQFQEGPNRSWAPWEIPDAAKVTVPEGLTIGQAAELFEDPQAFIEAASDPALVRRLGIDARTLEGFLMPNTYFFDDKPGERQVVERMVAHFEKEYDALLKQFPDAAKRDKKDVVSIASLIEEEVRVHEERPKVAAVIYNRLDKNIALQLDSTLQYALGKYGERILYEDKEIDSPYNTYLHPGLPPGPISSPGVASLRAAMKPADADYLYFVSNADAKTHTFSTTQAEHLRAVQKYRREIARQRRDGQIGQ